MDEESGKVIDGTARARHWRGSQPRSITEADGPVVHSEAPKSIASSLLVPSAMLEDELRPPRRDEYADGDGRAGWPSAKRTDGDPTDRNIFKSREAAVAASPRRPSAETSTLAVGLVRRVGAVLRKISDVRVSRPEFGASVTPWVGAVVGLAGTCALVAILIVALPTTSSRQSRSVVHGGGAFEFGRLKETLLSSTEGVFAVGVSKARPDGSAPRASARPSVSRVRHARTGSVRVAPAPTASGDESRSTATSSTPSSRMATDSSSSAKTAAVNDSPAERSPMQQTTQDQQVHYQPTSELAGPTGLGSQVGGSCNPKCS